MELIEAYFEFIPQLSIKIEDAESGYHQGSCDDDIECLRRFPYIEKQLNEIDEDDLKKELFEYGAWDEEDLLDHDTNLSRILWIACGNIVEGNV